MDIRLTLSLIEVAALESERMEGETLADVILRLIGPLVSRVLQERFQLLLARFQAATPRMQAEVLATLDQLFKVEPPVTPPLVEVE